MWGLNWGKGTGTGAEAQLVDEAGVMGFTPPIRSTVTRPRGNGKGVGMMCLVLDEAPLVHLGS